MAVTWNLREWLRTERGVRGPAEASRIILRQTGYKISTQAVSDLFNDEPKMLRVETLKALCSAFFCRLSDFCEVLPAVVSKPQVKNARTAVESPGRRTTSAETASSSKNLNEADSSRTMDFAAYFPNARNFS
jgi:Cro/C1-type helix-turn-helix DNA-binding protein